MNQTIAKIGAIVVVITVALFAAFLPVFPFGNYFVCMFLVLGYLLMLAGLFVLPAACTRILTKTRPKRQGNGRDYHE